LIDLPEVLTKFGGVLLVSFSMAYRLQNLPANGKQGPVPKEMYQILLTNKKQGKLR
jgi:hypothetical protein